MKQDATINRITQAGMRPGECDLNSGAWTWAKSRIFANLLATTKIRTSFAFQKFR